MKLWPSGFGSTVILSVQVLPAGTVSDGLSQVRSCAVSVNVWPLLGAPAIAVAAGASGEVGAAVGVGAAVAASVLTGVAAAPGVSVAGAPAGPLEQATVTSARPMTS